MGGHEGGKEGRFWTLDPIDGTKGFLRKDQYAVALALIENGDVVLGVLGCPNLSVDIHISDKHRGTLLYAVKGHGSFMKRIDGSDETSVAVSGIESTQKANFCESVESAHSSHSDSAKIAAILNVTAKPVRIDSQCKYGVLARGFLSDKAECSARDFEICQQGVPTLDAHIRPFRDEDLNRLLDIAAEAWKPVFRSSREILGSTLFDLVNSDPETEKRRQVADACRRDSGKDIWVAEENDEVVGFITADLNHRTHVGEILNNAVHPSHHHRGVGTLMYTYVLGRMKDAGMMCATVKTGADASHAPARRAYEKAGFSRSIPSVQYYRSLVEPLVKTLKPVQ